VADPLAKLQFASGSIGFFCNLSIQGKRIGWVKGERRMTQ
jgi:hypothetical protein